MTLFAEALPFAVVQTTPKGVVKVTNDTDIVIKDEAIDDDDIGQSEGITYEDVGGIGQQLLKARETIELPLKHPELFRRLGIDPPKGVLLHGPPGTGKTMIAKAVATETNAHFKSINGPEIISKYYGESEKQLREIFDDAADNAPAIIFIDEIDSICPKREDVSGEVERRVVAQMLTLMDGMQGRDNVVVIGATNRRDALDPALRRPGRFDREIEIGVPDRDGRSEIMDVHTRQMPISDDFEITWILDNTYGFVGADLAALVRESAMKALRRYLPEINLDEEELPAIDPFQSSSAATLGASQDGGLQANPDLGILSGFKLVGAIMGETKKIAVLSSNEGFAIKFEENDKINENIELQEIYSDHLLIKDMDEKFYEVYMNDIIKSVE